MTDIQALINRGEQFVARRQFEQALDCFLRASELEPTSAAAWCWQGRCQKFLHRVDEAIRSLKRALSLDPTLLPALYHLADLLFDCGKYEEARGYFEQALDQEPHSYMILEGLGLTLRQLDRFDEALERFSSATVQAPGSAECWNNHGVSLMNLNRLEEAMSSLERAVALDAKYSLAWGNLGAVQRRLGLSEAASKNLETATKLLPEDKWAWVERGRCLESLGHYQEAISCFCKATEVSPQFAQAWVELGWTYLESGGSEEAAQAFIKCLELEPQTRVAHIGLGHAWTALGGVEAAMKAYAIGFWFEGIGGPQTDLLSWWRTGLVRQNGLLIAPLAYLVYQMTFRLSQLSRQEFGVSLNEFPHTYFVRHADSEGKDERMAKHLPPVYWTTYAWWALATPPWAENGISIVNSEAPPEEPSEFIWLELPVARGWFEEAIAHCFEFSLHRWLMCTGENIQQGLVQSPPWDVALSNYYNQASRACSEGFAKWLLLYGERAFSQNHPSHATDWEAVRQSYAQLSETHSYRVGLEAFENIEKRFGELCAIAAYFVAFDLPHRFDSTSLGLNEARRLFENPLNNPNFRLHSLAGMPRPWDFRRNDGKRFIALAKAHIAESCKETQRCTVSGRSE